MSDQWDELCNGICEVHYVDHYRRKNIWRVNGKSTTVFFLYVQKGESLKVYLKLLDLQGNNFIPTHRSLKNCMGTVAFFNV